MSTGAIKVLEVQEVEDGSVIPSQEDADCPEPCGCDESNALRDLLQCIVEYDEETNSCDPDICRGECAFCMARVLLAKLEEKRRLRG
jgi:hypothetical protein